MSALLVLSNTLECTAGSSSGDYGNGLHNYLLVHVNLATVCLWQFACSSCVPHLLKSLAIFKALLLCLLYDSVNIFICAIGSLAPSSILVCSVNRDCASVCSCVTECSMSRALYRSC